MKKSLLTLACAIAALSAAAQNSVELRLDSRNIQQFAVSAAERQSRAEDKVQIKAQLAYDATKLRPYYVAAFNSETSTGVYYASNMRGVVPVSLPQGKYNIVAEFYNMDTDIFHLVVLEDAEVADGQTYRFDASTASKRVRFKMLLPDGRETQLADADHPEVEANVSTTIVVGGIAHEDLGFFMVTSGAQSVIDPSEYSFGDGRFDYYVNEVSDKWHFFQQRIAFTGQGQGVEADAYAAFLACKGTPAGDVANDPSTYAERGYYAPVAGTPRGLALSESESYSVMATPLWRGAGQYFMAYNPWSGVSTPRLNHSFCADYDPQASDVKPMYAVLRAEGLEYDLASAPYVPSPDGTVEYPANGFENYLEVTPVHALDSDNANVYRQLPGHPIFSYTADQRGVDFGATAPMFVIRVASLPQDMGMGPILELSPKSVGMLGEQRQVDVDFSKIEIKRDGQTLPYKFFDAEWPAKFGSLGYMSGTIDMAVENANAAVDGYACKTTAAMHWSYDSDDVNPPFLQALQVRQADGKIVDRLEALAGAKLLIAAGDYDYFLGKPENAAYDYMAYYWDACQPIDAKVECSIHGEGAWTELQAAELADMADMAGMGRVYEAPLDGLSADNAWHDLRIRLTDQAGNYQEQVIEMAFKTPQAGGVCAPAASQAEPVEWYSVDGRRVDGNAPGLYIARCSDGTIRKIIKK